MELLERSSFLDALAGYAAEARQGGGRLVLVSGEWPRDHCGLARGTPA